MAVAQVMAGYSLADADLLRRAMGKKIPEEMVAHRGRFIEGSSKNGVPENKAGEVFDLVNYFSGYGFNKAHSTAYGLITYQTAWMKAHHRPEMMAAVLTWEQNNRDKLIAYIYDCLQADIQILAPDINESVESFAVVDLGPGQYAIRYGLAAVKGVKNAARDIVTEREKNGPFTSLSDFLRRRPKSANKTAMKRLAAAGAFDAFGVERHHVEEQLTSDNKKKTKGAVPTEQLGFFSEEIRAPRDLQEAIEDEKNQKKGPWTYSERLTREKSALGYWITGHPLDRYHDVEQRLRTATSQSITRFKRKDPVSLVGIITQIHRIETKGGHAMTFVTITDRVGQIEVVLVPKITRRFSRLIQKDLAVLVEGILDRDGSEGKVRVDNMADLGILRARLASTLELHLSREDAQESTLDTVLDTLEASPGHCPVRIVLHDNDSVLGWIDVPEIKITPHPDVFDAIERITGLPDSLRLPGLSGRD